MTDETMGSATTTASGRGSRSRWTFPAIGAGIAVATIVVFARPAQLEAQRLDAETEALLAKARGLETLERTLAEAKADASAWRARAERELREVPDEPGQALLMQALRPDAADATHATHSTVDQTFTAAKPVACGPAFPKGWSALPVTVTVEGGFPAVYSLLRAAEGLDRLVRVVRVEVDAPRPEGKEDRTEAVSARIELDAIFRDPSLAAAGDSKEAPR
jgi:hypothetical protein